MAAHDTTLLDAVPRKTLAMRSESLRKPLAGAIGRAIDRAITLSGLTKQDAAYRMGYQDQSAVARWISGVETPQLARLFAVPELRAPLVQALAELSSDVEVTTTITVRRRA
jgi:hypothetical protein